MFWFVVTLLLAAEQQQWRQGKLIEVDRSEAKVRGELSILSKKKLLQWEDHMRKYLGKQGNVVHIADDYIGLLMDDGEVIGFPKSVLRLATNTKRRQFESQGHIINAIEANHRPEFTLPPRSITTQMFEDQGELQNGDYWACGVSDCNGDVQDLLFRFLNGNPQLPNPDPCLVNGGIPRVTPPAPDNDPNTYFERGPLATRRLMNVAPIANCPGGGTGVGCAGGGRQWPEDPAGNRIPNTCENQQEEPSCSTTNTQANMCAGANWQGVSGNCPIQEVQGRYWCKWPGTLNTITNPIQPALPNLGGGPRCTGIPQRCPTCPRTGMPPIVDQAQQCNVRCWDDTRSGGAHGRLEAKPSEDHWGWICYNVRVEDDGLSYILPNSCNCQDGCDTTPCDESATQPACIYIEPVNDCPSFKTRGDATILEDSPTCTGSPQTACTDQPSVGFQGCLNNLGSCCCPVYQNTGCTLNNWLFDIEHGGWMEHPYQSIYFDVTVDNPELFLEVQASPCVAWVPRTGQCGTAANAAFAKPNLQRDVNFVLKPNACGRTTVTITARDDGGESGSGCFISQTESFELTITPVNDPPVFIPGMLNIVVDEDSGDYRLPGWATQISAGPIPDAAGCERDQTITFVLTCGDDTKFEIQPAVDPVTGDLTFRPALNQFTTPGCTTCTVVLRDDGGTNDGGDDTANPPAQASQFWSPGDPWPPQLCITINSINDPPFFYPATPGVLSCEDVPYSEQFALNLCIGGLPGQNMPSAASCADNELLPPENQAFTFTVRGYDTSLFLVQPQIDAAGILTYTPAPGRSGTTELIVELNDGGNPPGVSEFVRNVPVTIIDVNDPPNVEINPAITTLTEYSAAVQCPNTAPLLGGVVSGTTVAACTATCRGTATCQCFTFQTGVGCLLYTNCPSYTTLGGCAASAVLQTHFINIPLVQVNEDTGRTCLMDFLRNINQGTGDSTSEIVTLTTSSNPRDIFVTGGEPTFSNTRPNSELCFEIEPNEYGDSTVLVTATDTGGGVSPNGCIGSDTNQFPFIIRVVPINDPPLIVLGTGFSPLVICEDSNQHFYPNFAQITPGPGDELTDQTIQAVTTTVTDATLFAVQPAVSNDGVLTFTPGPNQFGNTDVTLQVTDNLGAVATMTFQIQIKGRNDPPVVTILNDRLTIPACENAGDTACTYTSTVPVIDPLTLSPGPGETAEQNIASIRVVPDSNFASLFQILPTISMGSGILTASLNPLNSNQFSSNLLDVFFPLSITVTDNAPVSGGTPSCPGENERTVQLLVRLSSSVGRNPSFTKGRDISVLEDSGRNVDTQWATNINLRNNNGVPSFSCVPDRPELFDISGAVSISAITGTLTFTPAPNRFGLAVMTCTLSNGLPNANDCCAQDTFNINIIPVNDMPSLTTSKTVITLPAAATMTEPNFITNKLVGPFETTQRITNIQVTERGSLNLLGGLGLQASVDPTTDEFIVTSPTGFVLQNDIEIPLQIVALDNGGTERGGVDQSTPIDVTLSLVRSNLRPVLGCGVRTITINRTQHSNCATNPSNGIITGWATSVTAGSTAEDLTERVTSTVVYDSIAFSSAPMLIIPNPPRNGMEDISLQFCIQDAYVGGTAQITIGLQDEIGQTSVATCVVQVVIPEVASFVTTTILNDNVISNEDAPPVSITQFMNLNSGTVNRATITVELLPIVADSSSSFSSQPVLINDFTTLQYTSAANVSGVFIYYVCVRVSGISTPNCLARIDTFTIDVLPVNDAPFFPNVRWMTLQVAEDSTSASNFVERNWGGGAAMVGPRDEIDTQTIVSVSVTRNTDETLGSGTLFSEFSVSAITGDLTFTLKPNAYGQERVTISLTDSGNTLRGGSNTRDYTVSITVTAVNDPPSYSIPVGNSNIEILEDQAQPIVIRNWLTDITPGNPWEMFNDGLNGLNFIVTSSQPVLISSTDISISTQSGDISITQLQQNGYGSLIVTTTLSDGLLNAPFVAEIPIEILAVNDPPTFVINTLYRRPNNLVIINRSNSFTQLTTSVSKGAVNEDHQTIEFTAIAETIHPSVEVFLNSEGELHVAISSNGRNPSQAFQYSTAVRITLRDSGGTANGGSDTSLPQTINLQVALSPTTNNGVFTLSESRLSVQEDSPSRTIQNFITPIDANSSFVIRISSDTPGLFATPLQVLDGRHFSYSLTPDAFGTALITVSAVGLSGTSETVLNRQFLEFQVVGVNDAPSFILSSAVPSNGGITSLVSVRSFATDVSVGPPNEVGQNVRFEVTCMPGDLFNVFPRITSQGELQFSAAPNRSSTADCTAQAFDDGIPVVGSTVLAFQISISPTAGSTIPIIVTSQLAIVVPNPGSLTPFETQLITNADGTNVYTLTPASSQLATTAAALFSGGVLPFINDMGIITLTPAVGARGQALYSLRAQNKQTGQSSTAELLLLIVVVPTNAGNPQSDTDSIVTVALDVAVSSLNIPNWKASLAAALNIPDSSIQVISTTETSVGGEVTLSLLNDKPQLIATNSLLDLASDSTRSAMRQSLNIKPHDAVSVRYSENTNSVAPVSANACLSAQSAAACELLFPGCVWDRTVNVCVSNPNSQTIPPSSGGSIGTGTIIAIVAAVAAAVLIAAAVGWYFYNKNKAQKPQQSKTNNQTNDAVKNNSGGSNELLQPNSGGQVNSNPLNNEFPPPDQQPQFY